MEKVREALRECKNCKHGTGTFDNLCFHDEGCEEAHFSEEDPIEFKNFELNPELEAELKEAQKAVEKQKEYQSTETKELIRIGKHIKNISDSKATLYFEVDGQFIGFPEISDFVAWAEQEELQE